MTIGQVIEKLNEIKLICNGLDEVYELNQLPKGDGGMEVFSTAIDLLGEYADMLKAVKVQL